MVDSPTTKRNRTSNKSIHLKYLSSGMPGLEPAVGECCAHAAGVCLEQQNHSPNETSLTVDGCYQEAYYLTWDLVTEQMRRSWADLQVATEWGASGIAALLVKDLSGFKVLQRSCKGTGFDYWVGESNNIETLFQNKARLEVTGILNGSDGDVTARLKEKQDRFSRHSHDLPSIIVVVEFGSPRSRIEKG